MISPNIDIIYNSEGMKLKPYDEAFQPEERSWLNQIFSELNINAVISERRGLNMLGVQDESGSIHWYALNPGTWYQLQWREN